MVFFVAVEPAIMVAKECISLIALLTVTSFQNVVDKTTVLNHWLVVARQFGLLEKFDANDSVIWKNYFTVHTFETCALIITLT